MKKMTQLNNKKIGFIGAGKMGEALIRGLLSSDIIKPENLYVSDIDIQKLKSLKSELNINISDNNHNIVNNSDIVILAIKPQILIDVLKSIKEDIKNQLIISIAAGVSISVYEKILPEKTRFVRVMPNIAATIKEAAIAISRGTYTNDDDINITKEMFNSVGKTIEVKENLMDAVTGLSGSGPAYIFMVIEALADGGVYQGLDRDTAVLLSAQTVLGAAKMVIENKKHTSELKDMVTSPGGTTINGIKVLEEYSIRAAFINAVISASERSKQLGKK